MKASRGPSRCSYCRRFEGHNRRSCPDNLENQNKRSRTNAEAAKSSVTDNIEIFADEDGNVLPPPDQIRPPRDSENHEDDSEDEEELEDRARHIDPVLEDDSAQANTSHYDDSKWLRYVVNEIPVFTGRNESSRPLTYMPTKSNSRHEYQGAHNIQGSYHEMVYSRRQVLISVSEGQ